jgi:DNA polymerase I
MSKKMFIIDGNSLVHRAFHALPPFKTKEGELVNAVYGFYSILINIFSKITPNYVVVSFDVPKKTFRHKMFDDYKGTRKKAPDELYAQFGRIKEILNELNIPIFEAEGFEADDVLATISTKMKTQSDVEVFIVTSDKDALQLVGDNIFVLSPLKGGSANIIYTEAKVQEKFGLSPKQIIDLKALMGDPSDNIAGVKGVGQKTATKLLQQYNDLDGIYENIDEITGSVNTKLTNDKDNAYFSKELVTLVHDVPIDFVFENTEITLDDLSKATPLFEKLEFRSLINRMSRILPKKEIINPQQASLF